MSSSMAVKGRSYRLRLPTFGIFVYVRWGEMDTACTNVQIGTGVAVERIYHFCDSRKSVD